MSEWKELKIDGLPSDILVGDYEFASTDGDFIERYDKDQTLLAIEHAMKKEEYDAVVYRKIDKKIPTHEEIMTKWWLCYESNETNYSETMWEKVSSFRNSCSIEKGMKYRYHFDGGMRDKTYFIGRESADIPPEVN